MDSDNMKRAVIFGAQVFVLYTLLLLPWSGAKDAYEVWFRTLSRMALAGMPSVIQIQSPSVKEHIPLSTSFFVMDAARRDDTGHVPAVELCLDAWGVGWIPTALTLALIGASALPWQRRVRALIVGFVLINLYIGVCVRVFAWNGVGELFPLGNPWKELAGSLSYTLVTQMGAGFTAAILVWLLAVGGPREWAHWGVRERSSAVKSQKSSRHRSSARSGSA